jgi:hypothetical protein
MRRVLAPGFAIVVALALSACGAADLTAQTAPTVVPSPPSRTTTTTAAPVAWNVQLAEDQATQLEMAEQHYATCYTDAALEQSLVQNVGAANAPFVQSCATTGLTSAEVQNIQSLIVMAS